MNHKSGVLGYSVQPHCQLTVSKENCSASLMCSDVF